MSDLKNGPTVVVTIESEMPLPSGTTEEEALEAARDVFEAEIESDDGTISFEFRGEDE